MDPAKRCEVCGRPIPGSGEPLLPREIECQGCHAEVAALIVEVIEVDKDGADTGKRRTLAGAKAIAFGNHARREIAAGDAQTRQRRLNVAAGKHADDASRSLEDFTDAKGRTITVAQMKANAQAALDAEAAK